MQVEYYEFEYYCVFLNSINIKTISSFNKQWVSHAQPTKLSVIESFLKDLSRIN